MLEGVVRPQGVVKHELDFKGLLVKTASVCDSEVFQTWQQAFTPRGTAAAH